MRYIFGVETYNGDKIEVKIVADGYDKAVELLHNYHYNKGELHYFWFIGTDNKPTDVPYENPKTRQAACFMVALAGAYLGTDHLASENINRIAVNGIKDGTTQRLIKGNFKTHNSRTPYTI